MTPQQFKKSFPVFIDIPDAHIDEYLKAALAHFDPAYWGPFLEEGIGYWVASQLVLAQAYTQEQAPMYSDYTFGRVSFRQEASLARAQLLDPTLRTIYGQQLYALKKKLGAGALAI